MQKLVEQFRAPNAIGPGPHQTFLRFLLVSIQQTVSEMARRSNLTAPKDGSEPQQMVSLDFVTLNFAADIDDADPGYFAVIKCVLTGAGRTLSGLINGAGQEGVGGRMVTLMNTSATALTLTVSHEDVGSLAANRFLLPGGAGVAIAQDAATSFWYDLAALRWRVI